VANLRENSTAKRILKVVLHSGRDDDMHQEGVGGLLSKRALMEWKPVNERLMYVRIYTTTLKISLVLVYAPSNENDEKAKELFLEQLH
jgi:hypothetical protein